MPFIDRSQFLNESEDMVTGANRKVDILMKATGVRQGLIKGETQDAAFKDHIDVQSFHYGMILPYDSGTGMASGKRQHRPLRILKDTCSATPLLYKAAIDNEHMEVILLVRKSGGTAPKTECYLKYVLKQAKIIDFRTGFLDQHEILPSDQFSFVFQSISMEYKPQKSGGGLGSGIIAEDSNSTR